MVDMTFVQDFRTGEWIRCYDEKLCNEDIKKLDWAVAIRYEKSYDLCIKGSEIKGVNNLAELSTFYGLFACKSIDSYLDSHRGRKFIFPLRWRIHKGQGYNHIMIAVECLISMPEHFAYSYGRLMGIHDCFIALSIDLKKNKILSQNKAYANGMSGKKSDSLVSLPDNILAEICNIMQGEAKIAFGIMPSINIEPHGWEFVEKFVSRPFDVNITYWQDVLGTDAYEKYFPREQKDNYRPLCQYLGIVKPPKSLRKAYGENPYAPMIYMVMQQLSLQDINFIRRFFAYKEYILNFSLKNFKFDLQHKRFYRELSAGHIVWQSLVEFCRFVRANKSEKHLAKMLYRLAQMTGDEWRWYIDDAVRMFCNHQHEFDDDLLELLASKGPTRTTHDLMSVAIRSKNKDNLPVNYNGDLLRLECMLDDYEFHLVHETRELQEIGIKLYNCVETYRDRVLEGSSIICYVKRKGEYLACIEIQNNDMVVQAYAYNNQKMQGELLMHVLYWIKLRKLKLDVGYMAGIDISYVCYEEKRLPWINVAALDYEELMSIDEEDTPHGWYDRFGELLAQQRLYHLSPPPWIEVASEAEYLSYALPEGDRLVKAVQDENPEAMTALGTMYLQGKILRRDYDKARYWFGKAAKEYNYDVAWKCLSRLNIKDKEERLAIGLAYLKAHGRVMS